MNNLKIGGCVVLFNPDVSIIKNISTYLPFLEQLVAVDNSTSYGVVAEEIKKIKKVHYINMNGNMGIAEALNTGLNYLISIGCDYALTMDQDSTFPIADIHVILEQLSLNSEKYSVLGLNYNNFVENKTKNIKEVNYWLTSGNFVNLIDYRMVGGFQSELFIDYVDIEYGYKLKIAGKHLGYLEDYSLLHSIGDPIKFTLFGHTYSAMNHSPIRYYYRYRNSYYLYLMNKAFFKKEFFREIFINIPKMVIFESKKREKLKMIMYGLEDGYRQKLGAFSR